MAVGKMAGKKRVAKVKADAAASKKKRQEEKEKDDEIIPSESDEEPMSGDDGAESEDEEAKETAAEKRLRIAKAYVDDLRAAAEAEEETDDDEDNEGNRDSRVSEHLRKSLRESRGYQMRKTAHKVVIPEGGEVEGGKVMRGHKLAVTALALTDDSRYTYTCSKDGSIVKWDVEYGKKTTFASGPKSTHYSGPGYPGSFVPEGETNKNTLLACAVSWDGKFLAAAGMDYRVHVYDANTGAHLNAFPGHKDIVTSLAFRDGTHQLFSASFDRTIKSWSMGDMMYIDTLYGHQGHIIGMDCDHRERPVTVSRDHTCRLWKIQDETHLVFRGKGSLDCCCLAGTGAWVSGADDGCVSLWGMMKKKPVQLNRGAHLPTPELGAAAAWVGSVAAVRSSDVIASGAADGYIRLWSLGEGNHSLKNLYKIKVRGFVNAMALSRNAQLLVAGVGQEPRLGRWARDAKARNGLMIHRIETTE